MAAPDLRLGRWQDVLDAGPSRVHDASVRLLLTSPPYDNARTYEGTNEPVDFGELAAFALRVLMPGGTLALVLDGEVRNGAQSATPYETLVTWSRLPGWRFRQMLAYGRGGVPGNTVGWFRRDHEPLMVFVRDGATQVCEKERIADRTEPLDKRFTRTRRMKDGTMRISASPNSKPDSGISHRGSLWWYGSIGQDPSCGNGHPATFAEAFALDAVRVWSNPGDLVCDPYAGSGTVARACIDTGRLFVGAERVAKYHAGAIERLSQTSIFDRVGS